MGRGAEYGEAWQVVRGLKLQVEKFELKLIGGWESLETGEKMRALGSVVLLPGLSLLCFPSHFPNLHMRS